MPPPCASTHRHLGCDFRTCRLGLSAFLPLGFPSFISACGFGGCRSNSCIVRSVFSSTWGLSVMAKNPKPEKPLQPWDIRPPSPLGDNDENQIFNAVGQALTEWEHVENACAKLFAVLVSANQRQTYHAPAVRAYGCIFSTGTKAEMLRTAAKAYFSRRKGKAHFEAELMRVTQEYLEFANRRNEIAHGIVSRVFLTEKTSLRGHRPGAIGLYLLPSFYNPRKFKNEIFTSRYTSSDLVYYRQEFTKLCLRIGSLSERMAGKRRSSP